MNNIKKFALLLAVLAAGNSAWAQAQVLTVPPGEPYTFSSDTAAVGDGTITYQWFRDRQPIAGATDPDYILPDYLANGINVEFRRGAVSSTCPGSISYANAFVITFCTLMFDNLCWAYANVAQPHTFAAKPDMYTEFYQWNRLTAWSATAPTVSGWNSSVGDPQTWTVNPCPAGWRLPTMAEITALNNAGSTWVAALTRGNEVAGRFYGPNHATCTLATGGSMAGCIFLPALGYRSDSNGTLSDQGSLVRYWSDWHIYTNIGGSIYANSSTYNMGGLNKAHGLPVRCVR